jgi:hypothetical protein
MSLLLFGAITGYISWHGNIYGLIAAPFIALLWSQTKNKTHAYLITLSYYLAASHGLIKGAGVFFANSFTSEASMFAGLAIWVIPSLFLLLPWGLLWSPKNHCWRLTIIIIIISIPPIGLFGWANPITAAGILFPGAKWLGLAATLLLMILLCGPSSKTNISAITIISLLSLALNLTYQEPSIPQGWTSINTNISRVKNSDDEYHQNKSLIQQVGSLIATTPNNIKVILLPELVVGTWNEPTKYLWQKLAVKAKSLDITILLGTKIEITSKEYISGLIAIGSGNSVFLPDRVPVPISMWRPWTDKPTAISYFFDPGINYINGKKITTLICYEQLLIWPILHSMLYKPDIILASSNVWWAKDTNIPDIQKQSIKAWSRLFNVPILEAMNK